MRRARPSASGGGAGRRFGRTTGPRGGRTPGERRRCASEHAEALTGARPLDLFLSSGAAGLLLGRPRGVGLSGPGRSATSVRVTGGAPRAWPDVGRLPGSRTRRRVPVRRRRSRPHAKPAPRAPSVRREDVAGRPSTPLRRD